MSQNTEVKIVKDHTHPEHEQRQSRKRCSCKDADSSIPNRRCVLHDSLDFASRPKSPAGGRVSKSKSQKISRADIGSSSLPTLPSLDSLPERVDHRGGKRKGNKEGNKGGRSGKQQSLVQKAVNMDQAKENGIRDAEIALQQSTWELIADALYGVDSPYISSETQALYLACLFPSGDNEVEVQPQELPGPEDPAPAPEALPLPACTSTMRRALLPVDPWNFTMEYPTPIPWYARLASRMLAKVLPGRFIPRWLHHVFVKTIFKLIATTAMSAAIGVSMRKWWTITGLKTLSGWVTPAVKVLPEVCSSMGPLGWYNGQLISIAARTLFKAMPLAPILMGLGEVGRFIWELCKGDHTQRVSVEVRRVEDDELCISSACNEHHDVRSLSAGRVDRSKCGCFSKVQVDTLSSTFGFVTTNSKVEYVSDEVFANLSAMDNFRPGLSAPENVKRLRNSVGLAAYVNLDRGDKKVSLASTYWLAELKLVSDWFKYTCLQSEVGAPLE